MLSKNLAIMFTDMKGFTSRTSQQTRAENMAMLKQHEDLLRPVVEEYQGTIVKSIGDAFLITFESCTNAVLAGIAIQKCLLEHNTEVPEQDKIEIRVAISAGDVRVEEHDVFGEAVNVASRLEGITEANRISFTDSVFLSMNRQEVPFSEVGYKALKGIPYKIRVYEVRQDDPVAMEMGGPSFCSEEDNQQFLAELEKEEIQRCRPASLLDGALSGFEKCLSGKRCRFQIVPPRSMVPEVRAKASMIARAIQSLLSYALGSIGDSKGHLQVGFTGSSYRSMDISFMDDLPEMMESPHVPADEKGTSAIRGNPSVKFEIAFSDGHNYEDDMAFLEIWQTRHQASTENLDLSFCGVYRIVRSCGGTVSFRPESGKLSSFVVKLPAAR